MIDPETAVTLIRSVSSGLAEAHRIGLVHRDIKPANILINTDLIPNPSLTYRTWIPLFLKVC
ncbi:MAG: serine/threonine protein kinase [Paracoccaceae bacterium]